MRKRELNKIKNKKINGEFSDFELKEFVEEIKEYSILCKSIGLKIKLNKRKNKETIQICESNGNNGDKTEN